MSNRPLTPEEAHELALGSRLDVAGVTLGPWASDDIRNDPKRLAIVASRYKFVSKMLSGYGTVIEVGCGDGLGLPIVADAVDKLYAADWEERIIKSNLERLGFIKNLTFEVVDFTTQSLKIAADAVYSVDVLEHIGPEFETEFMVNQTSMLSQSGVMILGTPNITASQYASPQSESGHINLKSYDSLKGLMVQYFENVFMFGMNDEVLHTGFGPMCQYLWALGAGVKRSG